MATIANARRLADVDAAAQKLGLAPGLSLADARARHPKLVVAEADPHAEDSLLERIADACSRFNVCNARLKSVLRRS